MKKTITGLTVGTMLVFSAGLSAEVFDGIGKPMGNSGNTATSKAGAPMPPNHPPKDP